MHQSILYISKTITCRSSSRNMDKCKSVIINVDKGKSVVNEGAPPLPSDRFDGRDPPLPSDGFDGRVPLSALPLANLHANVPVPPLPSCTLDAHVPLPPLPLANFHAHVHVPPLPSGSLDGHVPVPPLPFAALQPPVPQVLFYLVVLAWSTMVLGYHAQSFIDTIWSMLLLFVHFAYHAYELQYSSYSLGPPIYTHRYSRSLYFCPFVVGSGCT